MSARGRSARHGRGSQNSTHRRPDGQRRLEAVSRALIIRVGVEQHTQSNLHIGIHLGELVALPRRARHWSRSGRREEKVDDAVRRIPRRGLGRRCWRSADAWVGEREPALEGGEGAEFLTFVDVGHGERLADGECI